MTGPSSNIGHKVPQMLSAAGDYMGAQPPYRADKRPEELDVENIA